MRKLISLLLLAAVVPGTLVRDPAVVPEYPAELRFQALAMPDAATAARHLGAFRLGGIWEMRSRNARFGGYSGLVSLGKGRLLAITDGGDALIFSVPGVPAKRPVFAMLGGDREVNKMARDTESATRDPATGQIWIGWEHINAISRHSANLARQAMVWPPAMRQWTANSGAEALVRLRDGRFVVLSEGFSGWFDSVRHPGLVFRSDPTDWREPWRMTFAAPAGFSPTDMAQMPDGRVLVLTRRLVWPFPLRFAGRISLADPAELRPGRLWRGREVAKLTSTLPVDNFEGIAIDRRPDGRLDVWLISDDNDAATQRTLLWRLILDPADLPKTSGSHQKARK